MSGSTISSAPVPQRPSSALSIPKTKDDKCNTEFYNGGQNQASGIYFNKPIGACINGELAFVQVSLCRDKGITEMEVIPSEFAVETNAGESVTIVKSNTNYDPPSPQKKTMEGGFGSGIKESDMTAYSVTFTMNGIPVKHIIPHSEEGFPCAAPKE